jgi:predicted RNA-binding Zn ribbon-like protein
VHEFLSPEHPCLDFVATVAERGTTDLEKLGSPELLTDWLVEAGLLDQVSVGIAELESARTLREAIYECLRNAVDGNHPNPAAIAIINRHAARPTPVTALGPDLSVERSGTVESALATLARDCIQTITSGDRRLRECRDQRCTRIFIDRSRRADRKWCGMKNCGDRAKAAAYRARHSQPSES